VSETDTELRPPPPRRLGRPPTSIPPGLVELLENSYTAADPGMRPVTFRTGTAGTMRALLRLARIYCHRQGKTLRWQADGNTLWLAMADRRPYTRRNP
jgi:hypothetical protein